MWSETPKFVYVHVHKHIHSLAHIHKCHEATILSICGLRNCFVTSAETSFFTFVLVYRACYAQWSRCFRWLPIIFFTNWALQFVFPIWKKQFKKWDVTAWIVKPMVVPIVRLNRCKLKNFVFCIYSSLSNYISIIIMH